jgi:DNA-binding transcriptional regulator YdaS (Cro superfamily)
MDLATYLKTHGVSQSDLADRVGVSQGMVSHWLGGRKGITAERARDIEIATNGVVQRHELRPDVFDAPTGPRPEEVAQA